MYKADLVKEDGSLEPVIVKKVPQACLFRSLLLALAACQCSESSCSHLLLHARLHWQAKEFGEAEVWMNERLMRVAPSSFAKFVTAFEEKTGPDGSRDKLLWLVRAWHSGGRQAQALQACTGLTHPYQLSSNCGAQRTACDILQQEPGWLSEQLPDGLHHAPVHPQTLLADVLSSRSRQTDHYMRTSFHGKTLTGQQLR